MEHCQAPRGLFIVAGAGRGGHGGRGGPGGRVARLVPNLRTKSSLIQLVLNELLRDCCFALSAFHPTLVESRRSQLRED
ncbi:hypothetical protein E2C01_095350 [Portunus trituberculatus]|uniref:Uncharacterized protein n=1 Tax=Portunus trituberculatus TaxID=210409 RepID=A0A5B7JZ65_PORTR|nr:hypothetical protein [Portunus trituberculatus]